MKATDFLAKIIGGYLITTILTCFMWFCYKMLEAAIGVSILDSIFKVSLYAIVCCIVGNWMIETKK